MKNLALILTLGFATFFDAHTMKSEQSNRDQEGVPIVLYKVNVQPPVEVLQIPSKKIVQLGGMISRSISIDCKKYNGIKMNAPIKISYDMTKEQLGQSLCTSFGVYSISFGEGVMPMDVYSRMFSSFNINR